MKRVSALVAVMVLATFSTRLSAQAGPNVATLIVDAGPTVDGQQLGAYNVAYTTVTVCQSGTDNCQTFDHIQVDTGSTGFRIISSLVNPALNLPAMTDARGNAIVECMQWVTSFAWGPIHLADVRIAGEVAENIPIQLMGDHTFPIPEECSSSGANVGSVAAFGANGIIGIGNAVYDCGSTCASHAIGAYYSCFGRGCNATVLPLLQQVPNPVAFFPNDNNGTVIRLPAVPAQGATNVMGVLIFGIDTRSNNSLGNSGIYTLDATDYTLTTVFKGTVLPESFVDSGSPALSFNDNSLPDCGSRSSGAGYYCPARTLNKLTATNKGRNGTSGVLSFSVANATQVLDDNSSGTAFSNLAGSDGNLGPSGSGGVFDWGLPFFFGRSVFTAVENRNAGGVNGPYVAYGGINQTIRVIEFVPKTLTVGAIGSIFATATSGLAVSFSSATPDICTVTSSTVTGIAAGTCTIHATQPGNDDYDPAPPVSRSITIRRNSQTLTLGAAPSVTVGGQGIVSATATSGLVVTFTSTTRNICTLSGSTVTGIKAGICTIVAHQAGDGTYKAATPLSQSFRIRKNSQILTFGAAPTVTVGGQGIVSATATSGLVVTFTSATPSICAVKGNAVKGIEAGTCTIVAHQAGNATYKAAILVSQSFVITA